MSQRRERRPAATDRELWLFPLRVWVIHWLLVQIPATFALRFGVPNAPSPPYGVLPPPLTGLAYWLVEPLRNWDGLWYRLVALEGYATSGGQYAKAAFWPLLPATMHVGAMPTGWTLDSIGYIVANAAFLGALLVLYRLIALDYADPAVARRALWALALFPTALFFSAIYTESLFLFLVVGALYLWKRDHPWFGGLVGILAALCRSGGVFLALPFLVILVERHRRNWRGYFPDIIPVAFPAIGPAIFGYILNRDQGNWRAFVDVQEQWNRYSAMPWETLHCAVVSCNHLGGEPDGVSWGWWHMLQANPSWATITSTEWRVSIANSDLLELVVTVLALALAVIGLFTLPRYMSAWVWPGLIIPLLQPSQVHALMSMPRFVLVLFPLFIVLGQVTRPKIIQIPALVLSVTLLVLLTTQFALWYWVS